MKSKTITLKSNQINCPWCNSPGGKSGVDQGYVIFGTMEYVTFYTYSCYDCGFETIPTPNRADLKRLLKREATKKKNENST